MLLTLWVVLSTAGVATFLLGHLLGFPGVASIGAVMVMIAGGEVVLNDIQVKTGEQIDRAYTEVNGSTVEDNTTVNNTYQQHSWTTTFATENAIGLGLVQILIGVLLFYQQMLAIGEGE